MPHALPTIDIEQFCLNEHCLFSAILAPPQCSLRGPVGDSRLRFVVTHRNCPTSIAAAWPDIFAKGFEVRSGAAPVN
jgi:hypothetical protein